MRSTGYNTSFASKGMTLKLEFLTPCYENLKKLIAYNLEPF